jgi:hypothetical protein
MRFIVFYILFLLFFVSCKKEVGVQGPAGAQGIPGLPGQGGPNDTGTIVGKVNLYNEFSFQEDSLSGVAVSLLSGTFQQTTMTDSLGNYQFHGIKTNTYDMVFSKNDFGTMKIFGLTHIAGSNTPTTVNNIQLLEMPEKTAVDSLSLIGNNTGYTIFTVILDTSSNQYVQYSQNFLLFVGKDANVSMSHYSFSLQTEELFNPDGNGGYTVVVDKSSISNVFATGDSLYIKVYTYNLFVHPTNSANYFSELSSGSFYIDPDDGYAIFPNASGSNVFGVSY